MWVIGSLAPRFQPIPRGTEFASGIEVADEPDTRLCDNLDANVGLSFRPRIIVPANRQRSRKDSISIRFPSTPALVVWFSHLVVSNIN